MRIRIKFYNRMRQFAPDGRDDLEFTLDEGSTLAALIRRLAVPPDLHFLALVNGQRADSATPLHDGDALVLLTPAEGG